MFGLKKYLDYALELDVSIVTKRMYAFHPDIVFSMMAWPRNILNRIIQDNLDYIKPRATEKQWSLVTELENMLVSPTFQEQWPEQAEVQFYKGRRWQNTLSDIRAKECSLRIEDIYIKDTELYEWWMRSDSNNIIFLG